VWRAGLIVGPVSPVRLRFVGVLRAAYRLGVVVMPFDPVSSFEDPDKDKNRPYHRIGRFRHSLPTTQATTYRWQFNASMLSCVQAPEDRAGLSEVQNTVGQTSCQLHAIVRCQAGASTRHWCRKSSACRGHSPARTSAGSPPRSNRRVRFRCARPRAMAGRSSGQRARWGSQPSSSNHVVSVDNYAD
jgi:hypothetical protein